MAWWYYVSIDFDLQREHRKKTKAMNGSKLLTLLTLALVNTTFLTAIVYSGYEPRWIAAYVAVVLLYSALYVRRLRHLPEGLRRRVGKAAVTLGAFLSALFFYSCAPGVSWWVAGAAWVGLAAAGYFLYDIFILEDDEEDADERVQGPATASRSRLPSA